MTKLEEVVRAMEAAAEYKFIGNWPEIARAAIEAMREPTDEMGVAARDALLPIDLGTPAPIRGLVTGQAEIAWQAMIDEILK